MRKSFLTLLLAIVSSVWMTNEASNWCMPSVRTTAEPWIITSGTFQAEGFPCEPDEECPPCLTIVLVTSDKTYYLVTDDGQLIDQLDTIPLGTKATVSGIPFTHGSYNYIEVHNIEIVHTPLRLNSLCDEWNVLTTAIYEYSTRYFTFSQKLTTDTIIGENMYVKSEVEHKYNGAYREGENRDIYFVPAAMNKEFLVYAWNAQVGDTLYNILVSSYPMYGLQYSKRAVVREIKETVPRTFIVDYEYIYNRKIDSADTIWWEYQWIEGIGMTCGPSGDLCPFDKCRDSIKSDLLCAYKNGEQIYTSDLGEQYGCEYNRHPLISLCDEWNILSIATPDGYDHFQTFTQRLTTDTIINEQRYIRIEQDGEYKGAMREGYNRDIYYIPANNTHEYLLYAFNAQVGDTLTNMWIGGHWLEYNGRRAIVREIQDTNPRTFAIDYEHGMTSNTTSNTMWWSYTWVEGIGLTQNPIGDPCPFDCEGDYAEQVLCAYKNGEQVYISDFGEQYGCEYNGKPAAKPSSLCDEWNILEVSNVTCGYCEVYRTYNSRLTTDTVIGGIRYTQLVEDDAYRGALREGLNRDIYYIPAGSAHEYLLYAFNAQEGDQLTNLWIGGSPADSPDGWAMTVEEIQETTPRTFVLSTGYTHTDEGIENYPLYITWIEGVGMDGPVGDKRCVGCADSRAYGVLCAYKNGEHVYTSEWGEQYGCVYNGNGKPEPMFTSDTKWHYKSYDMFAYTDYTPTLSSISLVDTLINNIPYQKIGGILFRSKGTKVWCTMDSLGTPVERLVYDFGLQVGDSIRNVYYDEEFWMEQEYIRYAKVTSVEYITLSDGRSARRISYDNYRPDDIEHIGSVEGILYPLNFPEPECGCGDAFKCCTRNDFLLYEVSTGACDEFFEAEQPADTIPLFSYTGDDPGSSTVDPVDPNQVVVTLKGDVLTVKETSGEEITLELSLTDNRNQMPALNRVPETETFRNEVTITLTEEGIYTLELTNPSWGYHIYGTFRYPQRKDAIDQNVVPTPTAEKIIRNGQLLIRKGEKVYTVQGTEINE